MPTYHNNPYAACAACAKIDPSNKACSRCGAHYCSKNCQRSDWPVHKLTCAKGVKPNARTPTPQGTLGQLPYELQSIVLDNLDFKAVMALRLTSSNWMNECAPLVNKLSTIVIEPSDDWLSFPSLDRLNLVRGDPKHFSRMGDMNVRFAFVMNVSTDYTTNVLNRLQNTSCTIGDMTMVDPTVEVWESLERHPPKSVTVLCSQITYSEVIPRLLQRDVVLSFVNCKLAPFQNSNDITKMRMTFPCVQFVDGWRRFSMYRKLLFTRSTTRCRTLDEYTQKIAVEEGSSRYVTLRGKRFYVNIQSS